MENVHPLRLRLLLEIERTGSISAAAEACGIGQPSASVHLRTLEMAIGQTLVTRTGRGSSLTAAGQVVSSHASRVLATLDSMRRALDARSGNELVLAASPMPSVALVPRILRQFSDRYPGVSVKLRTGPSETVAREIAQGEADIGIAGEVLNAEAVVRQQILVDELVGIARPGLFGSNGALVSLGDLAGHGLLLSVEGSSTREVTERHLARPEYRPPRVWVFDSDEAIKCAVADGVGVSFMSRLLVRDQLERKELMSFRVSGVERMVRPVHVMQPSVRELTPEGRALTRVLADTTWLAPELSHSGGTSSPST